MKQNARARSQQVAHNAAAGITPWQPGTLYAGIDKGKRKDVSKHTKWQNYEDFRTVYNPNNMSARKVRSMPRNDMNLLAKVVASDWANEQQAIVRSLQETKVRRQANPYPITDRTRQLAAQEYPKKPGHRASGKQRKLYNQRIQRIFEARETLRRHEEYANNPRGGQSAYGEVSHLLPRGKYDSAGRDIRKAATIPSAEKPFVNGDVTLLRSDATRELTDSQLANLILAKARQIKRYHETKTKHGHRLQKGNEIFIRRNLAASYGSDIANKWSRLSDDQKYNLLRTTNIGSLSQWYSVYDEYEHQFVSWKDKFEKEGESQYEGNRQYLLSILGNELSKTGSKPISDKGQHHRGQRQNDHVNQGLTKGQRKRNRKRRRRH